MIIKSAGVPSTTSALAGTLSEDYKKAKLGQDLVTGRQVGSVFGGTALATMGTFMSYVIAKNWKSLKGRDAKAYMSNLVINVSTIMWSIQKFYFSNTFRI